MTRLLEKPILVVSVLVLICGYLFFFQSGRLALTDPDETFYAQTAKEMLARGEWTTPYLYGKPQFEKPILFYWLVEASFKMFGVNEFAARFPSAVFGTIGVVAVYLLGGLLFSRRAGFFAALIMATSVEYIILSRACITDMVLNTFLVLSILFFFYGSIRAKGHFYILSAAAIGFATLTKGPIAIFLFGAAVILYLLFTGDIKAIKRIPLWQAALVFIVVTAPWYLTIYRLHGKDFMEMFFGFHNVTRFIVSEHKIGSQVYYNIPIILGGFFPWSVFLPFGFWHIFKKIASRQSPWPAANKGQDRPVASEKKNSIFILVWFSIIFLFFTASSTKLPTYIFPCFTSLAIIVAVLLDDFLKAGAEKAVVLGVRFSYYLLMAAVILGWAGAAIYAKIDYPDILSGIIISGLFLIFGMMLSLAAFVKKRFMMAFFLIVYAVAIFLYPASQLMLSDIERYETSKEVSGKLLALMKPGEKLGAESNYLPGLAFYTDKFPVNLDQHHFQLQLMNSRERVWAVMKEKNHIHLYDPKITKTYVKPSYIVYKAGKRAVITNAIPEDGKYLLKRERPQ